MTAIGIIILAFGCVFDGAGLWLFILAIGRLGDREGGGLWRLALSILLFIAGWYVSQYAFMILDPFLRS
jgi:hypothetical protein